MSDTPDTIHTIDDWYDGPRDGAATFRGAPYRYRSVYLDGDEWIPGEDRFELTPLSDEALGWMLERDAIFQRWNAARREGRIPPDELNDPDAPTALSNEAGRGRELDGLVEEYLAAHCPTLLVRAVFSVGSLEVGWEVVETLSGE